MDKFDIDSFVSALKNTGRLTVDALRGLLKDDGDTAAPAEGKLTARGRLEALFDPGTFSETGAFVRRRPTEFDAEKPDVLEGVITGYGSVGGRLVYAFSQDLSRTSGAVSEAHAKKICDLYRLAVSNGAPVVGFFDSSGALIPEGVKALAGYGSVMRAASRASGVVPQIAVIPGYCSGASAVIASMFDISFIVKDGGSISVNPPFIAEGAGGSDFASSTGAACSVCDDDGAAVLSVRRTLSYLPENNEAGVPLFDTRDEADRQTDLSNYENTRDARDLIRAICDDGALIVLYGAATTEIYTGLCSFGGIPTGVIASDRAVCDGALTAAAARKAARMVSFFDAFGIPVLTVVDSCGLDTSTEAERAPYAAELAKLASAYASAASPLVTLIAGEAYGTAFCVLGSRAIGADAVFALKDAKIAAMRSSAAVAFLQNEKISAEISREELEKLWDDTVANPVEAASSGEIDDVIEKSDVRRKICSAIYMTSRKSDAWASRRHSTPEL